MYLGFFFIHWSSGQVTQVFQSEPEPIEECPFCRQPSSIVYKIYNSKTRHYSSFTIGRGDFQASFTCRNCTQEGKLPKEAEKAMIANYLVREEFGMLVELHKTDQDKARKRLEKLIRKNTEKGIDLSLLEKTLASWGDVRTIGG